MDVTKINLSWAAEADQDIALPKYETTGSAGADVRANLAPMQRADGMVLAPGQRELVSLGLHMAIPLGYEVQIRPRSGLALKHGVTVANAPGTIDSDYRGVVGVVLINLGADPFVITHGERIAQMVVAPVTQADFGFVDHLDKLGETARGAGGFGSTGLG